MTLPGRHVLDAPVVIEARNVDKTFRIPDHRIDSFKERAARPFSRQEHHELRVLQDVSFDVHAGEFFGIVGRNGSGKSTLLKILASIYRADRGRIRTAGLIAPFIELGVGFNPEVAARENIVLNGVLVGLTRREAQQRVDAVLDFAELRPFADLKLKNYSSGMMVRLAFAVMVQADADIMLIDEVLAVGDAAFSQKCMDVFHERRRRGRTVVLVTHDMTAVQALCHRAMLIEGGRVQYTGDPEETATRYLRTNFDRPAAAAVEQGGEAADAPQVARVDLNATVLEAHLRDADGEHVENLEQGAPMELVLDLKAARVLDAATVTLHIVNQAGVVVAALSRKIEEPVPDGARVRLVARIENKLVPGRYFLDCWIRKDRSGADMIVQANRLFPFLVYGTAPAHGLVMLDADVQTTVDVVLPHGH